MWQLPWPNSPSHRHAEAAENVRQPSEDVEVAVLEDVRTASQQPNLSAASADVPVDVDATPKDLKEDDRCEEVFVIGNMSHLEHGGHEPLDARLSSLAQRLQELQQRYPPQPYEIDPTISGIGSPSDGMAMWWNAQSWAREVEPIRQVAELQPLWTASTLRRQDPSQWGHQGSWPTYGIGSPGPGGVDAGLHPWRDERQDLSRQADGDQGTLPGEERWRWPHISASESGRTPGPMDDGNRGCAYDNKSPQGQGEGSYYTDNLLSSNQDNSTIDTYGTGRPDHSGCDCGHTSRKATTNHEGQEGEGINGNFIGNAISAGAISASGGGGEAISADVPAISAGGGFRCRVGGDGEREGGRVNALWNALKSLQERIRGTPKPSDMAILAQECQEPATAPGMEVSPLPLTSTRQPTTMSPMTTSTTMNSKSTDNTCECHFGKIDSEMDSSYNVTEKLVRPSLAKRLAAAAMITTTMMAPLRDLIGAIQPQVDIMEIACSPESALTQEFLNHGYVGQRINYKTGFDLDSKKGTTKLLGEIGEKRPRLAWASMMCTWMSGLQNLTPRSPEEMDRFLKRRGQDLRRCDEVVSGLELVLQDGGDVAWEWPTTAVAGWKSKPLQRLQKLIRKHRQQAYWVKIDGCQYGLERRGTPVKKSWTILTSNRNLWLTLNKLCDGTHEHVHCRGPVAQGSSFYPSKMCKDILKAMKFTWSQQNQSLEKLAETYLLDIKTDPENFDHGLPHHGLQPLQAQPEQEVLALSRTRLHLESADRQEA